MNDREKHAGDAAGEGRQHGTDREKAQLAAQQAQQRQSDMAQRGQERRAAQQFKQGGPFGG